MYVNEIIIDACVSQAILEIIAKTSIALFYNGMILVDSIQEMPHKSINQLINQ